VIASLEGVLADIGIDSCLLDVNGVGYRILMPASALATLPERSKRVRIHTHLVVREDSMTLYGFSTIDQRDLFAILLGVSGMGPKGAMAVIGVHTPEAFRKAVAEEDLAALTMIPGIGKKTAARMIIDLKEKLAATGFERIPGGSSTGAGKLAADARDALEALGYSAAEAREALQQIPFDDDVRDAGDLVRAALRVLAR
jgi:holliday junction DNA helicase RuvA